MKKNYLLLLMFFQFALNGISQNQLNCDFTVSQVSCLNQEVKVTYTGGASSNATFLWDFDGAVIISGSGQGPYFVKWSTIGEKHITLSINHELQTCTATRPVVVIELPAAFIMTGGGPLIPGTSGVDVGLSGSQVGLIYKLRLNGQYTGVVVPGTGQSVSFGPQMVPGNYSAVARVDGSDCTREMEGVAIVTLENPPLAQSICMVTFDTAAGKNKVIWNKQAGINIAHYNIYKESYQTNLFTKIGEVPSANMSVYIDPVSNPLVKSDKYKISVSDSAGHESALSAHHKTIHLNINPGIFGFNLIWNHYEGFDFLTYKIHRKHNNGNWEVIDSIAGNVDSYTDFYTAPGITTYYVEVERLEPCSPSLKQAGDLRVISNRVAAAPLGMDFGTRAGMSIFPNPVFDQLSLSLPGHGTFKVDINRMDGDVVRQAVVEGPKAAINLSELAEGLYILKITGDKATGIFKFVKTQ